MVFRRAEDSPEALETDDVRASLLRAGDAEIGPGKQQRWRVDDL